MATKSLFLDDYVFYGSQCDKVLRLTSEIDTESKAKIFQTNVELFIFASVIGVLYNRKTKPDKDKSRNTKIFATQFTTHSQEIKTVFKYVLLTCEKEITDPVLRLNKTFRNPETEDNYRIFEEFMLGGIEELYDKLMIDTNVHYEDYLTTLNKLLSEIKGVNNLDDDDLPSTDDFF